MHLNDGLKDAPEIHDTEQALSLEEIFAGLQHYQEDSGLPKQVLAGAIENREAITPALLEWLQAAADQDGDPDEDWLRVNYAIYLLSQFREQRAFALILKLLALPAETLDSLLGDAITEDGRRFLLSTYDGNWDELVALAEDESVYEYSRIAAFEAMGGLMLAGNIDRERVSATWKHFIQTWTQANLPYLHAGPLSFLLCQVAKLGFTELRPDVEVALASDSFDKMIERPETILAELDGEIDPKDQSDSKAYQPITDAIAELSDWDFFQTPAERRETEARREEALRRYQEQLFQTDPDAARRIFGLRPSDPSPTRPQHSGDKMAKKKKRKLQRSARKKNRK